MMLGAIEDGNMKMENNLPQDALKASKSDTETTSQADFNRRQRMAALTKHLGTCPNLITPEELKAQRESN